MRKPPAPCLARIDTDGREGREGQFDAVLDPFLGLELTGWEIWSSMKVAARPNIDMDASVVIRLKYDYLELARQERLGIDEDSECRQLLLLF